MAFLGIEIGGTKLQSAVVDAAGAVIRERTDQVELARGAAGVRDALELQIAELCGRPARAAGTTVSASAAAMAKPEIISWMNSWSPAGTWRTPAGRFLTVGSLFTAAPASPLRIPASELDRCGRMGSLSYMFNEFYVLAGDLVRELAEALLQQRGLWRQLNREGWREGNA